MQKSNVKQSIIGRTKSMLKVDAKRLFLSPFFYIIIGVSLIVPILILVMTGMMDGSVSVNPQTGEQTVMEGFENVWQIIGAKSDSAGGSAGMSMDLVSMCNINMFFFAVIILVCLFVSSDFTSGYAKNLFTVRAKKTDYVISKTIICFIGAAGMFIAFFIGAMIGGVVAGLPFSMDGFNAGNILSSMLAKIFLSLVFVSTSLLASVICKKRTWMSMIISFAFAMLFFTMIPMITPLDATFLHVLLCLLGGAGFSVGLGAISNAVLNKTALV